MTRRLLLALFAALIALPAVAQEKKKVVLIPGKPSHGYAQHEHKAGCMAIADWINKGAPGFEAVVTDEGWPKDEAVLDGAAAVLIYSDGGNGHPALAHLPKLDELHNKGVGIGLLHYAVEAGDGKKQPDGRKEFLKWVGGYFETFYSVNPHWQGMFTAFPQHPVAGGLKPFQTNDEWYYNMRFRENMEGVTPILTAIPPDSTRTKKDDAHGGNAAVRAAVGKNQPEHVMWVSQNANGSRGFGCTGAHNYTNFANDSFRKAILNAIVWTAKGEVPTAGIEVPRPTVDELLKTVTKKKPETFDIATEQAKQDEWNKPLAAPAGK
ncbi:MAG: ThuA domain-containing protein [Phycisphaerae bacterium]|nr:ThuA domain-containing protein [Tepidisphaeraceae bacterium]